MAEAGRSVTQDPSQGVQARGMQAGSPAPGASGQVPPAGTIVELKASAHLMTLDAGLFCVFQTPGARSAADPSGLPGVRITLPPDSRQVGAVTIASFRDDGWLGLRDDAALVRVQRGPAQVLVTIYQLPGASEAPALQVMRLGEAAAPRAPAAAPPSALQSAPPPARASQATQPAEVGAHVQLRGDVGVRLGEWLGERGSRRWVEGFAVAPRSLIAVEDIEYQALLGRGWLSPWAEGGRFCGSRGMALPILGLRVRLRGAAAGAYDCVYSATFVDGTAIGPVANGQPCEAESLSPLEAFVIELRPRAAVSAAAPAQEPPRAVPPRRPAAAAPKGVPAKNAPAKPGPKPTAPAAKPARKPAPPARRR